MKDYPLFIPPEQVHSIPQKNWNASQAELYFEWFMSVKDDRVNYLLTALNEVYSNDPESDLKRIGSKVYDELFKAPFSERENGTIKITNCGLAMAADVGILLANVLMFNNSHIKWEILKKPKSDLSYRLPVLTGFVGLDYIEPIRYSTGNSRAILMGEENADVWWKLYEAAQEKV